MKACILLLGLAALLALPAHATQANQVKTSHAWIRLLPADLPAGGYLALDNQSSSAATLVRAHTQAYATIMFHRTTVDTAGRSTMQMLDHLTIPPQGKVVLAPAGYHLMLQEAKHPLKPGDTIDVMLDFADGSHLRVPFLVRPANASD